jgi:pimeloyl-ACP methyl ester carboxylesterase
MKPPSASSKPSLWLLALESRVVAELGIGLAAYTFSKKHQAIQEPRAVLVIPGLGMGDFSTLLFRQRLQKAGYHAKGWEQGINIGTNANVRDGLVKQVKSLAASTGSPISIIGWSLGGIFARELARKMPESVHSIITLGSPFTGSPYGNRLFSLSQQITKSTFSEKDMRAFNKRIEPPSVLTFAIHSKTDGIVNWQCSLEKQTDHTENREVASSHFGMMVNPFVFSEVLEMLAN